MMWITTLEGLSYTFIFLLIVLFCIVFLKLILLYDLSYYQKLRQSKDESSQLLVEEIAYLKSKYSMARFKRTLRDLQYTAQKEKQHHTKEFLVNEKRKETMLAKYGVEYAFQLKNESKHKKLPSD